ncbi:MAG TPA: cupin domain-containing protein [Nitrososphaera sp.]|jgi:mannose-6-phosphate isomerase-like protein (cupin superfamily)|nr:cupin domain-containing protein [Nitrososphaera sp.]
MNTQDRSHKVIRADAGRQFNVMGSMMSYKVTAEETGGAYSLAVEITPPHGGLPLHVHHREDEAMYILEGEYEIQCGDQVFRAAAGTFVFLPKDIPNRYQNLGDTPGKFIHITSPGGFEKLVERTSLICASGPPNMQQIKETAEQHGVEFV